MAALAAACALASGSAALAADVNQGWGSWWLPPVRSQHGPAIDQLFNWILWIPTNPFGLREAALVVFKNKFRPPPRVPQAPFPPRNPPLEMTWTIAPAIILAVLALF